MKIKIALIMGALALVASSAFADQGSKWIGIQLHGAIPTGDFGDVAGPGFGGTAVGTYMVTKDVGVGLDVGYNFWSGKDDYNSALQTLDEFAGSLVGDTFTSDAKFKFNVLQVTAHGNYYFPMQNSKMLPHVGVGLGIYNGSGKIDNAKYLPSDSGSDSKFGFNVNGGLDFTMSPMYTVGVNLAYHMIQTDPNSTSFFTAGVGVNFGMGGK